MKPFYYFFIIFLTLFLASCGQSEKNSEISTEKKNFSIETKNLWNFKTEITQEKTAIIEASSTLEITSETSGKIEKILVKEWQKVAKWAVIATLSDSLNNFDLMLKQAQNNISLQKANNDAQIINLENAISAAEMQYQNALQSYNHLVGRNSLKYDNLVQTNKETLKTYNDSYKNFLIGLEGMMTQYLHDADKIIGMTPEYQHFNNNWEMYLGAVSGVGFSRSQDEWNELYALRGKIRSRIEENKNFIEKNTAEEMKLLEDGYKWLREISDAMIEMLQNSVFGAGLTPEMQSGWLNQWNGLRTGVQTAESQFVGWKTQTNNFLENYQKNELATKLAHSESISAEDFNRLQNDSELNLAYKNADIETKQAIENAKIAVEQAKNSLENAKKSKIATEKQLAVALQNAEIGLMQSARNAEKLTITAPISGTITKVLWEVGQNVNAWNIIAEFSSSNAQTVIEIDPRSALFLKVWEKISAKVWEKNISGNIIAISSIAGKNLLSSVRITFENADNFIGQPAVISLNIAENISSGFLLPINAVKIISEWNGEISTFENGKIVTHKVQLGAMYGSSIEIFTDLSPEISVIISDISTFNEEIHSLQTSHF